ncbi:DUF6417 family protein [Streptomyces sp. NRRL B-3648]|uniref:DUF6417 family protein n=1 Tax=Streptomyces sp. NRRL B-3648 TaxID=1519493 RepID=UPI0006AFDC3E|nr:DUF6417 family protein [Streptomyces sp. NRRL B-3648]KOX11555.1 hypothetical protein ADL04_01415 [Streptomyces sp. NRRL B-3648]
MDGFEHLDVGEIEFAPVETAGERLQEAHDLLHWLRLVAAERGTHAREAGRWAKEIAACVPSQE